MAEQADGIQIESANSASITEAPPRRAPITTMAALAVVIAAAAGFFALTQGEDGEVSEIAAGQADESADTSADVEGATFEVADFVPVQFTDISSENSPGHGRVFTDDGLYFVLSSSPGRVAFDENTTDEQFMEAYRQDTLYVYSEESGWTIKDLGDRFIADIQMNDGVLYAISTGSKTEDIATFGTSNDQGQSWGWTELNGLPEINNITMLVDGEQDPVFYANRWGYPDYQEAMAIARDADLNVSEMNFQGADSQGFSYIEIDPDDPCALVRAQYLPELAHFASYRAEAPEAERDSLEANFEDMLGWMKEEIAGTGCEWDDAWVEEYSDPAAVENLDWPEATRVEWSDIGFEVPEAWTPWSTIYTFDGENFVDRGVPFSTEDGLEFGGAFAHDGRLTVSVWDPSVMREFDGGEEYDEATYQNAMEEAETVWSTSNGIDWISEPRNFDEGDRFHGDTYYEPKAGNQRFQLSWEAYEEEWATEEAMDSADAAATTTATTQGIAAGEAEEAMEEPAMEDGDYAVEYYEEPMPELQRSIANGPWETVTLAELAPGIDVGDRVLQDIRGSSLGVFLVYGPRYGPEGPPQGGQMLIHSNNGVDWGQHEIDADYLDFYGSDTGSGAILAFANKWNYSENGGGTQESNVVLISPAE